MIVEDKTALVPDAIVANPFFVLGVSCDATRHEIEREAQKLLGMLELGFAEARSYTTPLGPRERTPDLVRSAVAALRDPYQRLLAELWARHAPVDVSGGPRPEARGPDDSTSLRARLGWGR